MNWNCLIVFSEFFWEEGPQLSLGFPNGVWAFERREGWTKSPGSSNVSKEEEEEEEVEAPQMAMGSEEEGTGERMGLEDPETGDNQRGRLV